MIVRRVVLSLIRFYQRYLSGLKRPSCRFVPSCSAYAAEAIERFGLLRGGAMALWRLVRCQPLCAGGHDPVLPEARVCGHLEAREEAKP